MKIIKVVHELNSNNIEKEREYLSVKDYKNSNFLNNEIDTFIQNLDKLDEELQNDFIKKMYPNGTKWMQFLPWQFATGELIKITVKNSLKIKRNDAIKSFGNSLFYSLIDNIVNQSEKIEVICLEQAKKMYPKTINLSIGTYTLHPRNSQMLTSLEYFHKNLAMQKDDELIVLLGKMGAKSLRIIEGDIAESSGKANANANVNTVKFGGSVDIDTSKKVGKEKDLLVKFEGNVVNLQQNLLDNSLWFSDDSKLISIYESRKFDPNKIESYTLRNTYTETFDFDFDLAANYLVVKTDLKAQYQSISKKERLFEIEFGS